MREKNGYKHIIDAIKKLEKVHKIHMDVYSEDNQYRLTGYHILYILFIYL